MAEAGASDPPAYHPRSLSSFLGDAANAGNDSARRPSSAARTNHLAREGIAPATSQFLARTGASASPGRRTQQQQIAGIPGLRAGKRAAAATAAASVPLMQLAPRREWVPVSSPMEGWADWIIASNRATGVAGLMGLHVVAEASKGCCLVIVHKPDQAKWACGEGSSGYNITARIKTAKGQHTGEMTAYILFGITPDSAESDSFNACFVGCNTEAKVWEYGTIQRGVMQVEQEQFDPTLRSNVFADVLVQIRGGAVSLDVNGIPVFTSIRHQVDEQDWHHIPQQLSGFVGVLAKDSRVVLKEWRVNRPQTGPAPAAGNATSVHPAAAADYAAAPNTRLTMAYGAGSMAPLQHEQHIIDLVERDIVERDLGVTFDDIAALDTAKRLLQEAVVLPLMVPEFFQGIRQPWKGVLLFGPPGTGKTMLAKAVTGVDGSTFLNCSASTLISKYRGESEKILRCLFDVARARAPSVVFIDEIDALVASRSFDNEHESSRRLKTELFAQMDGVLSAVGGGRVMVMATTNCPWDLDDAIRRRLEKRIYVPLPDADARVAMFRLNLGCIPGLAQPDEMLERLSAATAGYSGADIHVLCREAAMMPMRRLLHAKTPQEIQMLRRAGQLEMPQITFEDLETAVTNTRPSVRRDQIARYEDWERDHASA